MTARTSGRPIEKSTHLTTQVHLEECKAWGTPRQSCANGPTLKQGVKARLENQVQEIIEQSGATWPAPQARDYKGATADPLARGYGESLPDAVKATPAQGTPNNEPRT